MNLLRDVVAVLSEEGVNVLNASTSTQRDDMVTMRFLFQVSDVEHVDDNKHRDLHFDQLTGEIEISLKIGSVDDVDDHLSFAA